MCLTDSDKRIGLAEAMSLPGPEERPWVGDTASKCVASIVRGVRAGQGAWLA
jgi:hypothetical protein